MRHNGKTRKRRGMLLLRAKKLAQAPDPSVENAVKNLVDQRRGDILVPRLWTLAQRAKAHYRSYITPEPPCPF